MQHISGEFQAVMNASAIYMYQFSFELFLGKKLFSFVVETTADW